ncbi:hypothetical protein I4F81_009024 [Pyropia yezoensis]|uniref:Uncharacterized protein n=1 Tax=Pyropia yezoensis TaxID=2788 RepID=A0ACC3C897_PYRYE|nr:hypothetical protein I4F81_009024 [Neopyropia yezoensis]
MRLALTPSSRRISGRASRTMATGWRARALRRWMRSEEGGGTLGGGGEREGGGGGEAMNGGAVRGGLGGGRGVGKGSLGCAASLAWAVSAGGGCATGRVRGMTRLSPAAAAARLAWRRTIRGPPTCSPVHPGGGGGLATAAAGGCGHGGCGWLRLWRRRRRWWLWRQWAGAWTAHRPHPPWHRVRVRGGCRVVAACLARGVVGWWGIEGEVACGGEG